MKVLFAVSNESISEGIVKQYQKEYKEILSYKNVYYFNAILKEIQKDKSYDRIIISEELEPFASNNYEAIDKFLFEKLDNISDEAQDSNGQETSIIFICTDRRTKGSSFLVKLFSIGIYNALLGNDRVKSEVCKLINKPRIKKEAKMYYKIDAEDAKYDQSNEDEVSELEIQNILNHFKKLGKNTDKYADSFNNIAMQYTDEQLKIIINCLPINVKAVLEEESPKYQEMMSASGGIKGVRTTIAKDTQDEKRAGIKMDLMDSVSNKIDKPIIIPSSVKKVTRSSPQVKNVVKPQVVTNNEDDIIDEDDFIDMENNNLQNSNTVKTVKPNTVVQKPTQGNPNVVRTAGSNTVAQKPVQGNPNVAKPAGANTVTQKPVQGNPNVVRPTGANTVVQKPVQGNPNVARPTGANTVVQKQVQANENKPEPNNDLLSSNTEDELDENDLLVGFDENIENDDNLLSGFETEDASDDLLTSNESEEIDEDLLPGFETEDASDDLLAPNESEEVDDDLLPGFETEDASDDLLTSNESEEVDEDLLPGFETEDANDDLLTPNESEEIDEDLLPGFEAENASDDLLTPNESEEIDEDLLPGFETEDASDDLLTPNESEEIDEDLLPGFETEDASDDLLVSDELDDEEDEQKRGRGRPRKTPIGNVIEKPKGKRGRPRKVSLGEDSETDGSSEDDLIMPGFEEDESSEDDLSLPGFEEDESSEDDLSLPGFEEDTASDDDLSLPGFEEDVGNDDDLSMPGFEEDTASDDDLSMPGFEEDAGSDDDLSLPGFEEDTASDDDLSMPGFEEDTGSDDDLSMPGFEEDTASDDDLSMPGFEEDAGSDEDLSMPGFEEDAGSDDDLSLPGFEEDTASDDDLSMPGFEEDTASDDDLSMPGFEEDTASDEDVSLPELEEDASSDDDLSMPGTEAEESDDILIPEFDEKNDNGIEIPDFGEDISSENISDLENEEYTDAVELPDLDGLDDINSDGDMLPGMDIENSEAEEAVIPGLDYNEPEDDNLQNIVQEENNNENYIDENQTLEYNNMSNDSVVETVKPKVDYSMSSLNSLLTKEKKIVAFLGTTKNGTSFLINHLGLLFSSLGINTAILDMTKNKNSYYIYTKNEENLRKIAYTSISKLQSGYAEGLKANKNLTVYTALPNDGKDYSDAEPILSTLVQNYSLILIDCDFDTNPSYFACCQELYLVQSMDILTIQPLTAFLKELKAKGVLEQEKIKVVINKEIKVRGLSTKDIIGGMSSYNDPAMSFMTELFNKDIVKACSIPFDENACSKYMENVAKGIDLGLNGYSKPFISRLRVLGEMVYTLTSKQTYGKKNDTIQQDYSANAFSSNMNNTLNQMRKKY